MSGFVADELKYAKQQNGPLVKQLLFLTNLTKTKAENESTHKYID